MIRRLTFVFFPFFLLTACVNNVETISEHDLPDANPTLSLFLNNEEVDHYTMDVICWGETCENDRHEQSNFYHSDTLEPLEVAETDSIRVEIDGLEEPHSHEPRFAIRYQNNGNTTHQSMNANEFTVTDVIHHPSSEIVDHTIEVIWEDAHNMLIGKLAIFYLLDVQ